MVQIYNESLEKKYCGGKNCYLLLQNQYQKHFLHSQIVQFAWAKTRCALELLFFGQTRDTIQLPRALKDERAPESLCVKLHRRSSGREGAHPRKKSQTVCLLKNHLRGQRVRMREATDGVLYKPVASAFILHKCRSAINLVPVRFGRCCVQVAEWLGRKNK